MRESGSDMACLPSKFNGDFKKFALCLVRRNKILLTGGVLNGQVSFDAIILDTFKNKWESLPCLMSARRDHASCATWKSAYVFGGVDSY